MGASVPGPVCEEPVLACIDEGTTALVCMAPPGVVYGSPVSGWSTIDRVGSAIRRSFSRMPGETAAKLASLVEPSALAMLAGTLLLWAGAHLVGIGEAIDLLMVVTGFIFVGWDAIKAVKHLVEFARRSVNAETETDLDAAGEHLAQAVAIIGVDVVLAFLTRRAVKAWKGRYKPSTTGDPNMAPGDGRTTPDGDITYSTAGSKADQQLALYHEQVHQFLTPKLQAFRKFRVEVGMSGYTKSQLLQWLEESLAEAYAQLRVNGVKGLPSAFTFTIDNPHYSVTVSGVVIEAAIYVGTIVVGGITLYVYLTPKKE
jgi:hypothetical protein